MKEMNYGDLRCVESNLKGMCKRLKKYLTAFYLKPSLMKI